MSLNNWRERHENSKESSRQIDRGAETLSANCQKLVDRDISEADTVTVIKDMLSDIFGYDKYADLTSEQQIWGTFCDLAVKIDDKIHYLAEIKSAGTSLNDNHVKQAVNNGAQEGIEWIILSNGILWKVYRIKFGQPIDWEEIYSFDLGTMSSRSLDDLNKLFMLCRESIGSNSLDDFHKQAQIVNRHVVANLLLGEAVTNVLRKEFRRLFDGMKVTDEELTTILAHEVIKRDALEDDSAKAAVAMIKKAEGVIKRKAAKATSA